MWHRIKNQVKTGCLCTKTVIGLPGLYTDARDDTYAETPLPIHQAVWMAIAGPFLPSTQSAHAFQSTQQPLHQAFIARANRGCTAPARGSRSRRRSEQSFEMSGTSGPA